VEEQTTNPSQSQQRIIEMFSQDFHMVVKGSFHAWQRGFSMNAQGLMDRGKPEKPQQRSHIF